MTSHDARWTWGALRIERRRGARREARMDRRLFRPGTPLEGPGERTDGPMEGEPIPSFERTGTGSFSVTGHLLPRHKSCNSWTALSICTARGCTATCARGLPLAYWSKANNLPCPSSDSVATLHSSRLVSTKFGLATTSARGTKATDKLMAADGERKFQ